MTSRTKPKPVRTNGARMLAKHLKLNKLSLYAFCRKHRFDYAQTHKALCGKSVRISVDFAFAVAEATDFDVPVESWLSITRRAA